MQLKKIFTFVCFSLISFCAFSQTIKAEKDLLCKIPLGTGEKELYYYSTDERSYKPVGININTNGELVFDYSVGFRSEVDDSYIIHSRSCNFKNGKFEVSLEERFGKVYAGVVGQNINGLIFYYGVVKYFKDDIVYPIEISCGTKPGYGNNIEYIPVEKGLIVDSSYRYRNPDIVGVEIVDGKQVRTINKYELNEWLSTQKGNYEVKEDYHLYKNGMMYSNRITSDDLNRIVARLPSGHCVHVEEELNEKSMPKFIITRPTGEYELTVEIPWSSDYFLPKYDEGQYYDWSFGNYGEIYALIRPKIKDAQQPGIYTKGNAELVCVRNYLKYFGVLTDDRIRLRSEATTSSESLGTYPINTGFRILEKGTKQETIGGDTGVWYKVRLLDGKEGWFFGAYVRDLYDGPGTPLPWPNVADWK